MTTYHYQCESCGFERTFQDRGIRSKEYCLTCGELQIFNRQVWMSASSGKQGTTKSYHINPDCQNRPEDQRQVDHDKLNQGYQECSVCNGSGAEHEQDHSYQRLLKQAAEGD